VCARFIEVEISSSGAGLLGEGIGYDELMLEVNYLRRFVHSK
jgi:hypothetical protein